MTDSNLIFLISLPRSGSTLTQKILGEHSQIYTRSEPWVMLHPLYELRNDGMQAEYNKFLEYKAVKHFIEDLPSGGEEYYLKHLRDMYLNLYRDYLEANNKNVFLDKTPRYYLVMNELQTVFPNSKMIVLVRNPLAILSSILTTWIKGNLQAISNFKIDLFKGLDIITEHISNNSNSFIVLKYETLITDPGNILEECFDYLELEYEEEILNYHDKNDKKEKWMFGDPENVYTKQGIDDNNDIKWIENLKEPQHWRLIHDYLHHIGKERFETLGYDFEYFNQLLLQNLPLQSLDEINQCTTSLLELLKSADEQKEDELKKVQVALENEKKKNESLSNEILLIQNKINYKIKKIITIPYRWIKKF